jgi:sec-independent protein translocase protein TatA
LTIAGRRYKIRISINSCSRGRYLKMFEGLFQPMHLLIILVIVLVIFGPGKLPELGSGLGKSIREFKKAMTDPDKLIENKPMESSKNGESHPENKAV